METFLEYTLKLYPDAPARLRREAQALDETFAAMVAANAAEAQDQPIREEQQ